MKKRIAILTACLAAWASLGISAIPETHAPDEWICQAYCGGFNGNGSCSTMGSYSVFGRGSDPQYAFEQMTCDSGYLFIGIEHNSGPCHLILATMVNSCLRVPGRDN
jgi:hypothetical protein